MKDTTTRTSWQDRANQGMKIETTLSFKEIQEVFDKVTRNYTLITKIKKGDGQTNDQINFAFKGTLATGLLVDTPEVVIVHSAQKNIVRIYVIQARFTQEKLLSLIPISPKMMQRRGKYVEFLDQFSDAILLKDGKALVRYTTENKF